MATRFLTFSASGSRSFDPATRSMRAVISTDAEIIKNGLRGRYAEVLPSSSMEVPAGAHIPLLDGHEHLSARSVVGSVRDITIVDDRVEATIVLSRRADVDPIAMDIADGHIRGVSVGYRVLTGKEDTSPTGLRRITATRWEMFEVSLVGVAANPEAQIRSRESIDMDQDQINDPNPTTPPGSGLDNRATVNAEIRSIATIAGLDQVWIDTQIDANATADAARAAAFASMQTRGSGPIRTARATVVQDHSDPLQIRAAMAGALAHRLSPGRLKLEGRAQEFAGHRMLEMVGDLAHARGDRVNLRDQVGLMERAVGAHSTSDFPLLLADAANKALLANYAAAEPTYRLIAAQRGFNDFRDHSFFRVGDFPTFQETNEAGELKYGTLSENREKVRAKELNAGIAIGRRALINDDLSALADFSSMIAIRAASDENARVYGLLAANAALSDGKALFHADHGNKATTGAALSVASVALAVASLRKQKSLDGVPLNLAPRFLVVGPDTELAARQVLAAITAAKAGDVNPWAGTMELVVDANITGASWYVVADPAAAPSLVYGYVSGAEGPQIRTEIDFDTRAVKVAAGLDFGCGVIDFRGLYKNEGQ